MSRSTLTRWRLASALSITLAGCASPPTLGMRPPEHPASAARGESHRTGSFRGSDGVELYQQSWHPRGTARAALVIHHGLKDYSDRYADLARRLTGRGIAVYAYDMRGHGRSAGMRASLDSLETTADDLALFVASVREREPGRPIFLLGHSIGGAIVALFATERRAPLAGLIVMSPALRVDRLPFEVASTPVAGALLPNFPAVDTPDAQFSRSPDVVRAMATDPLIYHPVAPARTGAGLVRALGAIWGDVESFDTPLLGMHGTDDRITDPRGTAEFVRRVRARDTTLFLYRGLYHDLLHEPERDQVMGDLEHWIVERLPSR
jgi:acylglycerol lipase